MKKYNIKIIYPGMHSINYESIQGSLDWHDSGNVYTLTKASGKKMYFPIDKTIIIEV